MGGAEVPIIHGILLIPIYDLPWNDILLHAVEHMLFKRVD
jgi:hypothetical protein